MAYKNKQSLIEIDNIFNRSTHSSRQKNFHCTKYSGYYLFFPWEKKEKCLKILPKRGNNIQYVINLCDQEHKILAWMIDLQKNNHNGSCQIRLRL